MEDSAEKEMQKFQVLSDKAFSEAAKIIEADEKNGKPFVPWAAKASDLLPSQP
jgi:hypothetical protein